MIHCGPIHLAAYAPSEETFERVELLREAWMQLCVESGLAAEIGKVMQQAPGSHSLTLLPKQHLMCTLVGHDMAHWPAVVRSWGVLVSPPPTTEIAPEVPGIYRVYTCFQIVVIHVGGWFVGHGRMVNMPGIRLPTV